MINHPKPNAIKGNLSRILSTAKNVRRGKHASNGMIFTDNWYDSHPRLLIFDPVLNPYDKLVWLAIRSRCTPDMSLTAFPKYDEIQAMLNISRGTVSSAIAKLRLTRWITLLCRDQERNESGQFTRDGNIYMVHGEPLSIPDTFELDTAYMSYVTECQKHRNADVRKIAELILGSLRHDIDQGQDLLEYKHPFERRSEAWMAVEGDAEMSFFGNYSSLDRPDEQPGLRNDHSGKNHPNQKPPCQDAVVHETNYGNINALRDSCQSEPVHRDSVVRTSSNKVEKKYDYKPATTVKGLDLPPDLIYPNAVSDNQRHLIELNLRRLPTDLPEPPKPWNSWYQLLLDELEGRIQAGLNNRCAPVWNPVSLMATYCKRLTENGLGLRDEGCFQIENAERVFAKRTESVEHENLFIKTREKYQQRTLERAMQYRPHSQKSNHGP